MSAPEADPAAPPLILDRVQSRRRLMVVLGAILAVFVAVAIMLGQSTAPGEERAASPMALDAEVVSPKVLADLESALRDGDRTAFVAAWDDSGSSQQQAAQVYDNLTSLRARISLDAIPSTPDDGSTADGRAGWDADVEVSWGLRGIDRADASTRLSVHFTVAGMSARVADIEPADDTPWPIWLMGPLAVIRDKDTLTAGSDSALAEQVERGLNRAHQDLAEAGVHWHGTLVAYVPPSEGHFERMVEASPGQYDNIAGVTAPVDVSLGNRSPQMIAVNPAVFAKLTVQGRRVVLSHEATHFATGAAFSNGPTWLLEGYADYVALGAARIPISVAAGKALSDVARSGAPAELPTAAEFSEHDADQQQLAYERSWLAARMIAKRYGTQGLADVYREVVSDGASIAHALRTELSLTVPALTRAWRDSLEDLADAG